MVDLGRKFHNFLVRAGLSFMVACRHRHLKGRLIGQQAKKIIYSDESMNFEIHINRV